MKEARLLSVMMPGMCLVTLLHGNRKPLKKMENTMMLIIMKLQKNSMKH